MKKVIVNSFLVVLNTALMISCKPTLKVSSDYDKSVNFSVYKTFSLYKHTTSKTVNELNADRIANAVRFEMTKKGYIETDLNPDLLVNAAPVLENEKYFSATTTGYGYGGFYRPYGYWRAPCYTTVRAYDYKEGSLVIDVVDAKANKLVWEGTGNAEFEKKPKSPDEVITNAVTKILSGFPQVDSKK